MTDHQKGVVLAFMLVFLVTAVLLIWANADRLAEIDRLQERVEQLEEARGG